MLTNSPSLRAERVSNQNIHCKSQKGMSRRHSLLPWTNVCCESPFLLSKNQYEIAVILLCYGLCTGREVRVAASCTSVI